MRPKDDASWLRSERRRAICVLAGWAPLAMAVLMPATMQAQVLSGAAVQLGQTSLNLPSGSSIYIYGMGTGGALAATNFAQGPYAQVIDQGGQVVAGLAMTPSNNNSFTTDCADYTIGAIGVTGFKTVSASYAADNQPHPTSVSDSFLVSDPAVVVVFAIAGGEDRLDLQGLPGLQIDAQKGPDQSHGIAIAIGHSNLGPGKYTVTETTEGDPGRDPAHEGDLIGVFVFTGGSGVASISNGPAPTSGKPSPSPATGPLSTGPPSPPTGNVPRVPTVLPPYAFNGAYATYNVHWAQASVPLTVTVSDIDPNQQTFKLTTKFGGVLAAYSGEENGSLKDDIFVALNPSSLRLLEQGALPHSMPGGGGTVNHAVSISVPAGRFITEEVTGANSAAGAAWFDRRSGLLVKAQGGYFLGLIVGPLAGLPGAEMDLVSTNIPTDATSSFTSPLAIAAGVVVIAVAVVIVILVATRRREPAAKYSVAQPGPLETAVSAARGSSSDVVDKLTKLKSMLDAGLITDDEFREQKAKLLG